MAFLAAAHNAADLQILDGSSYAASGSSAAAASWGRPSISTLYVYTCYARRNY